MSFEEYSYELYESADRVKEAFFYDDVYDDLATVMWYAGLSEDFKNSDYKQWEELIKKAQNILHIDLGR